MMRKLSLWLLLLTGLSYSGQAQRCGSDEVNRRMAQNSPTFRQNLLDNNATIAQFTRNANRMKIINTANGPVYDIPVVIHVIHTGGAIGTTYNPADSVLVNMISYLNKTYAATWPFYPNASSGGTYFPVQFSLAKRDPNCNSTTGIVRINGTAALGATYTSNGVNLDKTTGISETAVKGLSDWNNNDYYNIWVVNKIDSNDGTFGTYTAGYAYFPGSSANIDGTVMLARKAKYGEITLPHEIGHAFSLYHVFEGDDPGNTGAATTCPSTTNCTTTGDLVCDTEPMKRSVFNCPTGTNACTGVSYIGTQHNFMDYSNCQDHFTSGQKTRWMATLLNIRGSLISSLGAEAPGASPHSYNCTPTINNPFNTFNVGPCQVTFNDMTGTSTGGYNLDGSLVYIDRSCQQQANVIAGQSYTLSVLTKTNAQHVRVYLDYNDDGVFNSTNELIMDHTGSSATETHSKSITIPTSPAVTCTPIRMRVVSDVVGSAAPTACGSLDYGQAEDYSVVIRPAVSATLSVTFAPGSANPSCSGSSLSFNAAYSGTLVSPVFRWYVNGVFTGTTGISYSSSALANGDKVSANLSFVGTCGADSLLSTPITIVRGTNVAASVTIAVTGGSNPGCAGTPITFTATPTNGGSAPTYKWYVGSTLQTGVTGATFTSSTIPCNSNVWAILTSNAACASIPIDTSNTINYTCGTQGASVALAVTGGSNPTCVGNAITFTATPTNGGTAPTYRWFINGTVVSGASGTTLTRVLNNGDSVNVELTSNYPCATKPIVVSSAIYIVVIPNITPSVTTAITKGSNPGCKDSLVQFTATPANAGATPSYTWYLNGVAVASSATYNNTNGVTGDKVWVRIIPSGIGSACYTKDSAFSSVTVLDRVPTPSNPIISFIGHDLVSDSANVIWYGPAGLLPGGISQSYTPTVQGDYYAVIPNALCGGGKSNVLTVSPLMVNGFTLEGVQIFPNPTTGMVNITWNSPTTTKIKVYTPSGTLVMEDVATLSTKKQINLSGLSSGIYFISLQDEHGQTGTIRVTLMH